MEVKPGSTPAARLAQREAHQQRHRPPGGAFLPSAAPGRTRDVEVRPAQLASEAREIAGRSYAARRSAADIRHIGEIRAQLLLVVLPQRHLPDPVPGVVACSE